MRTKSVILLAVFLFSFAGIAFADKVSALQYFFIVKKVFPDISEVTIFINAADEPTERPKITKAAAQMQLKVKLFLIESQKDIGANIQNIPNDGVLIVYQSDVLMNATSRMFVLSKAKEKNISVVTSSREYSQNGALLGLVKGADNKLEVLLNLKHSQSLATRFTEAFNAEIGVKQTLQ